MMQADRSLGIGIPIPQAISIPFMTTQSLWVALILITQGNASRLYKNQEWEISCACNGASTASPRARFTVTKTPKRTILASRGPNPGLSVYLSPFDRL
jgi:hypothetical protein